MTRSEGRAFQERWRRVARAEQAALRRSSLDERLRVLASLMASADAIGGARRLSAEDARVRRRWSRLYRILRG